MPSRLVVVKVGTSSITTPDGSLDEAEMARLAQQIAAAVKGGDKIVSTFDTRDIDKSQPEMNCGTHVIVGGTGKYKGITGREPFSCQAMPALAGPGGYTALDIPHNTSWEIKR